MRRLLVVVLVLALGALAWFLPAAETTTISTPSTTEVHAPAQTGHADCPWARSDDLVDTLLVVQSSGPTDVRFTFPASGAVRETAESTEPAEAAGALPLAGIAQTGLLPAVVEFTNTPTAVGFVEHGAGSLAIGVCPQVSSKVWHLPGGSTLEGQSLKLQLFNPFSDDARATVAVTSEAGLEPVPEFEGVTIPGRSWKLLDLTTVLPLREVISVSVTMEQGVVIPAMVFSEGGDTAVWTSVEQSDVWEFPVAQTVGLASKLVISNDNPLPAEYEIDVVTETDAVASVMTGTVDSRSQAVIDVSSLADAPFGLRVRAGSPVAVTVIADDGERVAATGGIATAAERWFIPGFGAVGESTAWFMNSGSDIVTVSYRTVDAGGAVGDVEKIAVEPGRLASVTVATGGIAGLSIEANHPIAVAWSGEADGAVGYAPGVPIP